VINFIKPRDSIIFLISLPFIVLATLLVTAPFSIPPGTLTDLTGTVGAVENNDQFEELPALPRFAYLFGDVECHQIASRSYFLNDNQMPVCARCLGIFLSIPIGLVFLSYRRIHIHPLAIILGFIPFGVDALVQMYTSYESSNVMRMITGIIAGLTVALAFSTIKHEIEEIPEIRKKRERNIQTKSEENSQNMENNKN